MTTITRRVRDRHSRIDAAIAVAAPLTSLCLAVAAAAFVAPTQAEPPMSAPSSAPTTPPAPAHDNHMP